VIEVIQSLTLLVLAASALLVLLYVYSGSTIFDRALAVEALSLTVAAAILLGPGPGVDAALGLALFAFVTTAMLGYFLGHGEFPHE
jgi:multisubunit Na+/H+ antiporter MnhF subunit